MGDVYLGEDTQTGQKVAIKRLKPEFTGKNATMIVRFRREGEALRKLNHPNIVKMLDAVEQNSFYYLIMEYVPGGDLHDLIADKGQLPVKQTLRIGLELADALARAHHLNIIHRDLKPANILISETGTPLLTDFGIAHIGDADSITAEGSVIGSYAYLSPEIFMGDPPGAASDIWAFGIILYEMLTATRPFQGSTQAGVMSSILMNPLPDPERLRSDLPDGVIELLYRCLAKQPGDRISSARLLGAEIENLLRSDETPLPLSASKPPQMVRVVRRAEPTPTSASDVVLPRQSTPFIGREKELEAIISLIKGDDCSVVTLLGPGGMGKTRLSIEAGSRLRSFYPYGVYFTPLAPLTSSEQVVTTIADVVGLRFGDGSSPEEQLIAYLDDKKMLLILDNFEHVLPAAEMLGRLIAGASEITLLISSRARLNLRAECLYEVHGLNTPEISEGATFEQQDAVQMFVSYARRVQPGYTIDEEDRPAIRRICQMVGGAPLGIELAAAWVRSLPPAEIVEELTEDLDFLQTERADLPDRQKGMRAAFEYSWNILNEKEQASLRKLSVFRGEFTRQEAKIITGTSVQLLMSLVDHSLLQRSPAGRYSVLELIRQYAAEKLSEEPEEEDKTRRSHAMYFAAYLDGFSKAFIGSDQLTALTEVEAEFDDIRAAWEWASEHQRVAEIRLMILNLMRFMMLRGRFADCEALFSRAADHLKNSTDEEATAVLGMLETRRGVIATHLSQYERSKTLLENALSLAEKRDDKNDIAFCKQELGNVLAILGEKERGKSFIEESIAEFEALDDSGSVARGLYRLGFALAGMGQIERGIEVTEKCLEISRANGDTYRMAGALSNLGSWYLFHGHYAKGTAYREEGLDLWRQMGNSSHIAHSLSILGGVKLLSTGDPKTALPLIDEGQTLSSDVASKAAVTYVRSFIKTFEEHYDEGLALGKQALELAAASGNFASVMHAHNVTGFAMTGKGHYTEAAPLHVTAMGIAMTVRSPAFMILMLPGFAILKAHKGDQEGAVRLLSLALHHPTSPGVWTEKFPTLVKTKQQAREDLSKAAFEAAWEAGKSLDIVTTAQSLVAEFNPEKD